MSDVSGFSHRDRLMARVEAAAEELAMRIHEYDEYIKSLDKGKDKRPEEQARAPPSDESMSDAPSDGSRVD
ncbi:hypothetical protein ACJZ2D_014742 [Fusarium nematophilum]